MHTRAHFYSATHEPWLFIGHRHLSWCLNLQQRWPLMIRHGDWMKLTTDRGMWELWKSLLWVLENGWYTYAWKFHTQKSAQLWPEQPKIQHTSTYTHADIHAMSKSFQRICTIRVASMPLTVSRALSCSGRDLRGSRRFRCRSSNWVHRKLHTKEHKGHVSHSNLKHTKSARKHNSLTVS